MGDAAEQCVRAAHSSAGPPETALVRATCLGTARLLLECRVSVNVGRRHLAQATSPSPKPASATPSPAYAAPYPGPTVVRIVPAIIVPTRTVVVLRPGTYAPVPRESPIYPPRASSSPAYPPRAPAYPPAPSSPRSVPYGYDMHTNRYALTQMQSAYAQRQHDAHAVVTCAVLALCDTQGQLWQAPASGPLHGFSIPCCAQPQSHGCASCGTFPVPVHVPSRVLRFTRTQACAQCQACSQACA